MKITMPKKHGNFQENLEANEARGSRKKGLV